MLKAIFLKSTARTVTCIVCVSLILTVFTGCNEGTYLTVNYEKDKTLRYKFISSRDIEVDMDPSKKNKNSAKKYSEYIEVVIAYTPIEVDPYGETTIEALCQSVNIKRGGSRKSARDAMDAAKGSSFIFTVGPTGKMLDKSQLDALLKEIGKKAFRKNQSRGRIKEPDMIGDFIATQRFLNNAVTSIKGTKGIAVGQSWDSVLSIPVPMVMKKARNVVYTLERIDEEPSGRVAVIRSSFSPAESAPDDWPIPYTGSFNMSGPFGFLRNYRVIDLQGHGSESFNIDTGRSLKYDQQYRLVLESSLMIPIGGITPQITIDQKITMQLLDQLAEPVKTNQK